jgi:hypothetical protein
LNLGQYKYLCTSTTGTYTGIWYPDRAKSNGSLQDTVLESGQNEEGGSDAFVRQLHKSYKF